MEGDGFDFHGGLVEVITFFVNLCYILGRFTSADSIIPGGVHPHFMGAGGLDRSAYVNNSPVNFTDPTGHKCVGEEGECEQSGKVITGSGAYTPSTSVSTPWNPKKNGGKDNNEEDKGGGGKPFNSLNKDDSSLCEGLHSGDPTCVDGILDDSQITDLTNDLVNQSANASDTAKIWKWVTIGLIGVAAIAFVASIAVTGGGSLALLLALGGITASSVPALLAVSTAAGIAAAASAAAWSDFGTKSTDLSNAATALSNNNNGHTQVAAYGGSQIDVSGKGSISGIYVPQSGFNSILNALGQ